MKWRTMTYLAVIGAILVLMAGCAADDDAAQAATPEPQAEEQSSAGDDVSDDTMSDPGETAGTQVDTQAPEFRSAEAIGMTVSWRIMGEELEVEVSGPTTGWVAVGFKPSRAMRDANILIGYVSGDDVVMTDQFGVSMVNHREDTELGGTSDVTNVSGNERDGATTIRFSIPLDSGDQYDQPLAAGETLRVILAYGPAGADDLRTFHGDRTGIEITL
ncbi:MAG: DOMON domain-containing protein [Spirochaetota bacterium]